MFFDAGEMHSACSHEGLASFLGQHDDTSAAVSPTCSTFNYTFPHEAIDEASRPASTEPPILGDLGGPQAFISCLTKHEQDLIVLDADATRLLHKILIHLISDPGECEEQCTPGL